MYNRARAISGDPYWTKARFNSQCPQCKQQISRGDNIYYYPRGKAAYCNECGHDRQSEFLAMVQDELVYSGRGW